MEIRKQGYCPFRIEVGSSLAGCKVRMGEESLCYSQDARPLIQEVKSPGTYYCPLLKFKISNEIYKDLSYLVDSMLAIQDEESTSINIWPLVSGISSPHHKATTTEGILIEQLSKKVRNQLEEIVYEIH